MEDWRFCVIGNIARSHTESDGTVRYGTPAYCGGTRVYIYGKYRCFIDGTISVLGLSRGKRFEVHQVPVGLIENVRCSRVFKPSVLNIMSVHEFTSGWWERTKADKLDTEAFVREWHEQFTPPSV